MEILRPNWRISLVAFPLFKRDLRGSAAPLKPIPAIERREAREINLVIVSQNDYRASALPSPLRPY